MFMFILLLYLVLYISPATPLTALAHLNALLFGSPPTSSIGYPVVSLLSFIFIFESAVSLSVFALLIACFSACQCIKMATSPAGRMLTRQFQQMQSDNDSIPGISCGLVDNNVFEWEVMLMISDDVKLYGGEYHLTTWNLYRIQQKD